MTDFAATLARVAGWESVPGRSRGQTPGTSPFARPVVDLAAVLAAILSVGAAGGGVTPGLFPAASLGALICLAACGAYDRRFRRWDLRTEALPALKGACIFSALFAAVIATTAGDGFNLIGLLIFSFAAPAGLVLGRLALAAASLVGASLCGAQRKVLLWGHPGMVNSLAQALNDLPLERFDIERHACRTPVGENVDREAEQIALRAAQEVTNEVILCEHPCGMSGLPAVVDALTRRGITLHVVSGSLGRAAAALPFSTESLCGAPLFSFRPRPQPIAYAIKRLTDVVAAAVAAVILLPLWAILAMVLAHVQGRPVVFRQKRVREGGRRFDLYKFRTMVSRGKWPDPSVLESINERTGPMFKARCDPRVTPLGHWLRRLCIDETPQVLNVLKGEISLIGARPPLPSEVKCYKRWHRERFAGWMGITGLWQVSKRAELEFEDIVFLDMYYNYNFNPALDLKIALETFTAVATGRCYA